MARLGIDADIEFGSGSEIVPGDGSKDLALEVAGEEVQISSRGFDFKRYLEGQRDVPLEVAFEANSKAAGFLLAKHAAREDFQTTLTTAAGDVFQGYFIVTKFNVSSPISGEEEMTFSLRLSAKRGVDEQPTFTPRVAA